jgi:hypothetical protein
MKIIICFISIFLTVQCTAQVASFKEIKRKPNSEYFKIKKLTIIFPVVVTKNPQVDKLINSQIKTGMFDIYDTSQSLNNIISESINDGLINLSYQVTYNRDGLVSFCINAEGCGAHCSSWNTYFIFDLTTGKSVTINDIFLADKIDSFTNIVRADKIKTLTSYKEEEKDNFKNNDIDSMEYHWAISEVDNNCINEVSVERFAISDQWIEIFDPCEFPNAIRSQEPSMELRYAYSSILGFLRPRFRKLIK